MVCSNSYFFATERAVVGSSRLQEERCGWEEENASSVLTKLDKAPRGLSACPSPYHFLPSIFARCCRSVYVSSPFQSSFITGLLSYVLSPPLPSLLSSEWGLEGVDLFATACWMISSDGVIQFPELSSGGRRETGELRVEAEKQGLGDIRGSCRSIHEPSPPSFPRRYNMEIKGEGGLRCSFARAAMDLESEAPPGAPSLICNRGCADWCSWERGRSGRRETGGCAAGA